MQILGSNMDYLARVQLVFGGTNMHPDIAEMQGFDGLAPRFRVPDGRNLVMPAVLLVYQTH